MLKILIFSFFFLLGLVVFSFLLAILVGYLIEKISR